jgi:CRISPR-associated protein Csb3
MTNGCIPIDLFNPGEVLASLGFLEVADAICGRAAGGFDWTADENARFLLSAESDGNPFEVVLEFLAKAGLRRVAPPSYSDPPPKGNNKNAEQEDEEEDARNDDLLYANSFPIGTPDRMTLPIRLINAGQSLNLTHWADGSSRNDFKLYAGNRSAARIAWAMLAGTQEKPRKNGKVGPVKTRGIRALWEEDPKGMAKDPFHILTAMGGSFNFDPRGAWTGLDAGYSPNMQNHNIASSPVVELLASIGLENARPIWDTAVDGGVTVHYAVWCDLIPASLARAAISGAHFGFPLRNFKFTLASSGKNKIVTFAKEEVSL